MLHKITLVKPEQERYVWSALYRDGTRISEQDTPEGHGFGEVDATQVHALGLFSPSKANERWHGLTVPEGARAVFFRRRTVKVNPLAEEDQGQHISTTHCIGWMKGEQAVYLFVFADGSTLLTDELQAL